MCRLPKSGKDEEGEQKVDETLHQCSGANGAAQDSQFSIFERADEDVVLLHGGIFVAIRVDDLVAPGGGDKENNIKDKEKQSSVNRLMHFTHEGRTH